MNATLAAPRPNGRPAATPARDAYDPEGHADPFAGFEELWAANEQCSGGHAALLVRLRRAWVRLADVLKVANPNDTRGWRWDDDAEEIVTPDGIHVPWPSGGLFA